MCFGGGSTPDMPKMPEPPTPPRDPTKPAMVVKKKKKPGASKGRPGDTSSLRIPLGVSSPTKGSGLGIPAKYS